MILIQGSHFIKGDLIDSEETAFYRSKASKYYASVTNVCESISMNEKKEPAPVTISLLKEQKGSVPDLLQFSTYDEKQVSELL